MAVIRIELIADAMKAASKSSKRVAHLIKEALESIDDNPAAYPTLDEVPLDFANLSNTWFRKVKITHGKHDLRMIYLHRIRNDGVEQVDFLWMFARRDGYKLNWDEIRSILQEADDNETE